MKTREHACTVEGCNKSFRTQQSLLSHLLIHESSCDSDKSKKCKHCERVFTTKQSMREHSYTHLGKKNFRCPESGCGKTFSQSTQLCNHRKVHREIREMMRKQSLESKDTKLFLEELSVKFLNNVSPVLTVNLLPPVKSLNSEVDFTGPDLI